MRGTLYLGDNKIVNFIPRSAYSEDIAGGQSDMIGVEGDDNNDEIDSTKELDEVKDPSLNKNRDIG